MNILKKIYYQLKSPVGSWHDLFPYCLDDCDGFAATILTVSMFDENGKLYHPKKPCWCRCHE